MHRILLIAPAVLLTACASHRCDDRPAHPGAVSHLVFFKLKDQADIPRLIADCDAKLPGLPGVTAYAAGTHVDIGRANVDKDYDVALVIGFATLDAYKAYLDHPEHTRLVETWRPRWESIHIYDVGDTP